MRLAPTLQKVVREVDAGLRLRTPPQTYSAVVDQSIVTERIMAALGGFFGLLALMVAGLGIFGAMAYQVSRRVSEIGLRIALGASSGGITALVLREVAVLLLAGCLIGGAAALALTGLTRKMLFGVTPADPGVFVLAAVVLGWLLAGGGRPASEHRAWIPWWRWSRVRIAQAAAGYGVLFPSPPRSTTQNNPFRWAPPAPCSATAG
jgi:ABC-type antimicrobial peptide transport system permease subunit